MNAEEVKNTCKDIETQVLSMLEIVTNTVNTSLADVRMAEARVKALKDEEEPLAIARDLVIEETDKMTTHYINLKNDLETEHDEYVEAHNDRMKKLVEQSVAEAAILEAKNNELRGDLGILESTVEDKQIQLDKINSILNSKR